MSWLLQSGIGSGAVANGSSDIADQCQQGNAKDQHIDQHTNRLPAFKTVEDGGKLCCLLRAPRRVQDGSSPCEREEQMQQEQPGKRYLAGRHAQDLLAARMRRRPLHKITERRWWP